MLFGLVHRSCFWWGLVRHSWHHCGKFRPTKCHDWSLTLKITTTARGSLNSYPSFRCLIPAHHNNTQQHQQQQTSRRWGEIIGTHHFFIAKIRYLKSQPHLDSKLEWKSPESTTSRYIREIPMRRTNGVITRESRQGDKGVVEVINRWSAHSFVTPRHLPAVLRFLFSRSISINLWQTISRDCQKLINIDLGLSSVISWWWVLRRKENMADASAISSTTRYSRILDQSCYLCALGRARCEC